MDDWLMIVVRQQGAIEIIAGVNNGDGTRRVRTLLYDGWPDILELVNFGHFGRNVRVYFGSAFTR